MADIQKIFKTTAIAIAVSKFFKPFSLFANNKYKGASA